MVTGTQACCRSAVHHSHLWTHGSLICLDTTHVAIRAPCQQILFVGACGAAVMFMLQQGSCGEASMRRVEACRKWRLKQLETISNYSSPHPHVEHGSTSQTQRSPHHQSPARNQSPLAPYQHATRHDGDVPSPCQGCRCLPHDPHPRGAAADAGAGAAPRSGAHGAGVAGGRAGARAGAGGDRSRLPATLPSLYQGIPMCMAVSMHGASTGQAYGLCMRTAMQLSG